MPRRTPTPTVSDRLAALIEQSPGPGPDARGWPDGESPRAPSGAAGSDRGWVPAATGPAWPTGPTEPPGWEDPDERADPEDEQPVRGHGPAAALHPWDPSADGPEPRDPGEPTPGRHRAPRSGPRVVSLPASLDRTRTEVAWPAVAGVLVLLVLAGVVLAVRVGAARAAAQPRAVDATGSTRITRTGPPTGFPTTAASPGVALPGSEGTTRAAGSVVARSTVPVAAGPTAAPLVVEVAGLVVHAGVRTLAVGARVGDALAAAGGVRAGADLSRLNLARPLLDGEQVFVPAPGQDPPRLLVPDGTGGAGGGGGPGVGSGAGSGGGAAGAAPVDLNTADLTALDGLPGVGPVLAQRILDWRATHGRFTSVDELGEVSGIGDKVLQNLRPLVRV